MSELLEPEGCTPADAKMLREVNHALAQESHRRAALLREWLDTELDAQDEEYQSWIDSFTARVKVEIDEFKATASAIAPEGLYVDFGPDYPSLEKEAVVEYSVLPSGRIVVMGKEDSYWFESNGRSPKGSFLTPWPITAPIEPAAEQQDDKVRSALEITKKWADPDYGWNDDEHTIFHALRQQQTRLTAANAEVAQLRQEREGMVLVPETLYRAVIHRLVKLRRSSTDLGLIRELEAFDPELSAAAKEQP